MNPKFLTILVLMISLSLFAPPSSVSAFWPFDLWRQGNVKGVEIGTKNRPTLLPGQLGTGIQNKIQNRLMTAVKKGKISQAQSTEIQTKLSAIQVKRQELLTLEKSFRDWVKANRVPTTLIDDSAVIEPTRAAGL